MSAIAAIAVTVIAGSQRLHNEVRPATIVVAPSWVLSADSGEGAGVFVEARPSGEWHVWTTCDGDRARSCKFRLTFETVDGSRFESAERDADNEAAFTPKMVGERITAEFTTTHGRNGVRLRARSGTDVRLTAELDGARDRRLFVWTAPNGRLERGAPSDPVVLRASRP